jgi:hypothetical protein
MGDQLRVALLKSVAGVSRLVAMPDVRLEGLKFDAVRIEAGRVEVDTVEQWRWFPAPLVDGKGAGVARMASYQLRYRFVRGPQGLLLDSVEPRGGTARRDLADGPHVVASP